MLTQEEIDKAAEKYLLENRCGDVPESFEEVKDVFKAGAKYAQSKMYSEEDMRNAFDSGREFNSLDGVVDVHIVLPMGGDMSDLQPLYPTFTEYLETIKKK